MKIEGLFVLLLLPVSLLYGQKSVNCDSAYRYFENSLNKIGLVVYDEPPMLIRNQKDLYIANTDSLDFGTIFVRLIVSEQGEAVCAKVVRSHQELLNADAIQVTQGIMFSPARRKGKPVMSMVVLPIKYGVKRKP